VKGYSSGEPTEFQTSNGS